MYMDVIFVMAMLIALVGSAIFLKQAFTAYKSSKRLAAFGKYAACVVVFLICAWGFVFSNNLLWYGQNPELTNLEMTINTEEVEETSFLYLLEKFDYATTLDDIVSVMGNDYEVHEQGGHMIRYVSPDYTINGEKPLYISFTFNKKGTEILKITWSYKNPASELFAKTLDYLENNAFGEGTTTGNRADWQGIHLEDTGEYLILQRLF